MNDAIRMQLSAFVDGELPENEAELLLRRLSQDAELRQEVAEYMAVGRLMRGEAGIAGADRLHERIAAEIDDRPLDVEAGEIASESPRVARPLVGAAIAAAVAFVAIFVLQQSADVEDAIAPASVADQVVVPAITPQQEQQRRFLNNHADSSSELGSNSFSTRSVTLEFSEEVTDDEDASDEALEGKSQEAEIQP